MQNTPRAFASRPLTSIAWGCASLWFTAMLATGGCSSETPAASASAGTVASAGAGSGSVVGVAGILGSSGGAPGGGSSAGSPGSTALGGSSSTAGNGASNGGTSNGGMSNGGMSNGGAGGSAPKPCMDLEPPADPKWPDATCENWATESTSCKEAWFAKYCDVSCGRCVPTGGGTAGAAATAVDCSNMGLPSVTGGNGYATRYWDCCQPHCGQSDGHRCNQDGTTRTGSTQSSCSGGGSFACYDEAPKAVNECLSYGYIAKSNPNCGGCYRIQFTGEGQYNVNDPGSKLIKGKQMVVKVSNTGGDVAGSQFDLMIPGGGVGQFNACSKQWGTSDLGAQYGGFLTQCTGSLSAKKDCVRQQCMKIPSGAARDGCIWFVDWFQAADNPKFTSQATDCPF